MATASLAGIPGTRSRRPTGPAVAAGIAWIAWIAACGAGARPPGPVPAMEPDPCLVVSGSPAEIPDTVTILVAGPVNPAPTPWPGGPGERLISRHIYETLIRVDCEGRTSPGLAESWSPDRTGAVWNFRLRTGARFADGSAIDAAAVRASWERDRVEGRWPWTRIMEVETLDAQTLVVRLDTAWADMPAVFGDPALAVAGAPAADGRRVASGPYHVADPAAGPDRSGAVVLAPLMEPGPVIRVVAPGERDPRDWLDRSDGADLVITRDPVVVSYAARRSDLGTTPLPWDRTYVLVTDTGDVAPTDAERHALARDAVRGEARGAEPPFLPAAPMECRSRNAGAAVRLGEIGYLRGDPVARSLAERIWALATSTDPPAWLGPSLRAVGGAGSLRVVPREPASLDSALAAGRLAAYLLALPRWAPAGCAGVSAIPAEFTMVALVDTRAHVVARAGGPAFRIHADGTIMVDNEP